MGGCLRPQDSLWDGAHDARLTGDVVDEILGSKVDQADWSGVPEDLAMLQLMDRSMWFSAECMGLYRGGLLCSSGLSSRLLCCA